MQIICSIFVAQDYLNIPFLASISVVFNPTGINNVHVDNGTEASLTLSHQSLAHEEGRPSGGFKHNVKARQTCKQRDFSMR